MYYRILVNKNGVPFFRTSRLHNGADLLSALAILESRVSPPNHEASVLEVNDDGEGRVLTEDEVKAVSTEVAQNLLSALPIQADPQA